MNKDTRLSGVLHVLLHLGQVSVPLTSEVLANTMGTKANTSTTAVGRPSMGSRSLDIGVI